MYSHRAPRVSLSAPTTLSALGVLTVGAALFVSLRSTRPQDLIGALLFLGIFLTLGWLIAMVRRASRRDPLLRQGSGCAQESSTRDLMCSLPDGHHGEHLDHRTNQRFQETFTGLVSGVTFYRDADGRREMIHDAF